MRSDTLVEAAPDAPVMSVDAWFALPEDAPEELVGGRLVEAEVPDFVHETIVGWLLEVLRVWARGHDAVVGGSGVKYAISAGLGRMPDVSLFLAGRRPPAHGIVRIPPDVAVEVVSRSPSDARRDRVAKVRDYAGFGIRWYWLVDPELRTFEVLELRESAYAHAGHASTGTVAEIPGCPDLVLDLDALWAEVDALPR
jgi:Uma2 family endonuclease